jgi:hypothetical protein
MNYYLYSIKRKQIKRIMKRKTGELLKDSLKHLFLILILKGMN